MSLEQWVHAAHDLIVDVYGDRRDKMGRLAVDHPLAVAILTRQMGTIYRWSNAELDKAEMTALLHDVLEDFSDWSLDDFIAGGFPPDVVRAVEAVSRNPGELYLVEYIPRVKQNRIAWLVKMADLTINIGRSSELAVEGRSLMQRYSNAVSILMDGTEDYRNLPRGENLCQV